MQRITRVRHTTNEKMRPGKHTARTHTEYKHTRCPSVFGCTACEHDKRLQAAPAPQANTTLVKKMVFTLHVTPVTLCLHGNALLGHGFEIGNAYFSVCLLMFDFFFIKCSASECARGSASDARRKFPAWEVTASRSALERWPRDVRKSFLYAAASHPPSAVAALQAPSILSLVCFFPTLPYFICVLRNFLPPDALPFSIHPLFPFLSTLLSLSLFSPISFPLLSSPFGCDWASILSVTQSLE